MKKYLLAFVCLIGVWTSAAACDVCGCSSGASYLGTLPQISRSFIGLRYNYRSNTIYHLPSLSGQIFAPTTEHMHTTELWGRFFPVKRLQVIASLPFSHYIHNNVRATGMGDATLLAGYMLINTGDTIGKKIKQTFTVSGGIKLPTGQRNLKTDGERLPETNQPGTGSTDFLANVFYTIRYRKLGFAADATYKINTTNKEGYQFGNRFTTTAKGFMWFKADRLSILPSIGSTYENGANDSRNNQRINFSGGNAVFGNVGIDLYYRSIGVAAQVHQPLAYAYNGNTSKPNTRLTIQFFVTF